MTTTAAVEVNRLDAAAAREAIPVLAEVLRDCVEGGASVSFLAPLTQERAEAFWTKVGEAVGRGDTALFVARDESGIVGTVQVLMALPENQPHRGEIAKLLVHRRARRRGIADSLMRAAEREAAAAGKTLLTLDTASAEAKRVYERLGWTLSGIIPDFALNPDRTVCDTAVYWKRIA